MYKLGSENELLERNLGLRNTLQIVASDCSGIGFSDGGTHFCQAMVDLVKHGKVGGSVPFLEGGPLLVFQHLV